MPRTRRPAAVLARASVLALLAATLPTLLLAVTSAPATALVQPCTVSYTVPGGPIAPASGAPGAYAFNGWTVKVTDPRTVTDIDFSIDLTHPDSSKIFAHLIGPKTDAKTLAPSIQGLNSPRASGPINGVYTFDEEVGTATMAGASPPPGTYDTETPEAGLEGGPGNQANLNASDPAAAGVWSVWMNNYSPSAGTMRSVTLTLTYATCDSDGDGHEDRADNCPTVANTQADLDTDGFGDECDVDIDADSFLNADDGCARVAAATLTGCPEVRRTAKLRYKSKVHRLRVTLAAAEPACRKGARAAVWHKRGSRDKQVKVVSTNRRGVALVKVPRAGRYYVTVSRTYVAGHAECTFDRSRTVRVPRR